MTKKKVKIGQSIFNAELKKDPWLKYIALIGLIVIVATIVAIGYWFKKTGVFSEIEITDSEKASITDDFGILGNAGDVINGIITPLISSLAVWFTILALYLQYMANAKQRADINLERFENKFYEMLRLHKENVNEIEISTTYKGRRAYVKMFHELQYIYGSLVNLKHAVINPNNESSKEYRRLNVNVHKKDLKNAMIWLESNKEEMIKIAYHHMYYGVNKASKQCHEEMFLSEDWQKKYRKIGRESLEKNYEQISKAICKILAKIMNDYSESNTKKKPEPKTLKYPISETRPDGPNHITMNFEYDFVPFDGHASKLAHINRHIYQLVKFVTSNRDLTWQQKYDYITLLRAQMSGHEQAIFFFNAIWFRRDRWWADEDNKDEKGNPYRYFLDFALIENIPFHLPERIGVEVISYFIKKLKQTDKKQIKKEMEAKYGKDFEKNHRIEFKKKFKKEFKSRKFYKNPDVPHVPKEEKLNFLFEGDQTAYINDVLEKIKQQKKQKRS